MIHKVLFVLLLMNALVSWSQKKKNGKEAETLAKDAQYYFDRDDHFRAWQTYRKLLLLQPANGKAVVNAASSGISLGYGKDSLELLESSLLASSIPEAKYFLALLRHRQSRFNDALSLHDEYLAVKPKKRRYTNAEVRYHVNVCINAKKFTSMPRSSVISNAGEKINSAFDDYAPVIMPDESALYFTSKRQGSTGGEKNADNNYFEDIYVAYSAEDSWKIPENAGFPLNSGNNDACVAISPDGQRMIIYRTAKDKVSGDLYHTRISPNGRWASPALMNSIINSPHLESSACFSNDTSEIYFSSDRPGGYGGKDLYRIRKLPNGGWGNAFNLGPSINTPYNEDAPFLHPDGVTLYFSSGGHNTMGGYDVFRSVLDATENTFSEPENLGFPINGVDDDIFFVLSVDGQRGYYSSVKPDSKGGNDIYEIDTRFSETDLVVKHGYAYHGNVPGRIKISLYENDELSGIYLSNPSTGKFILVVNPFKPYKVVIEEEGYEAFREDLSAIAFEQNEQKLRFILKKNNANQ